MWDLDLISETSGWNVNFINVSGTQNFIYKIMQGKKND